MDNLFAFCRLCAVQKLCNELIVLQTNEESSLKVLNKLARLNVEVDFTKSILPKTVCFVCMNSLESAFSFVTNVEKAQASLSQVLVDQKQEIKEDFDHPNKSNLACKDYVVDVKYYENNSQQDTINILSTSEKNNATIKDETIGLTATNFMYVDLIESNKFNNPNNVAKKIFYEDENNSYKLNEVSVHPYVLNNKTYDVAKLHDMNYSHGDKTDEEVFVKRDASKSKHSDFNEVDQNGFSERDFQIESELS